MALSDHNQRIHPVADVEPPPPQAPPRAGPQLRPSTPPVSPPSSATEKGNRQIQRQYVPPVRPAPVIYPATPKRRRSCLCRCLCWTVCVIVLLLIIIGATIGILYLAFKPKIPTYSIDSLNISDLQLNYDMSLYAKFDVKITAYNPNKKIGIYYEKGGVLSVWYTNSKLCEGSLPIFYHGHRNKTVLNVDLTGRTVYGSTLMTALVEQQRTGRIPLNLRVEAPVSVKLGALKLRKVRILGNCLLVVDSLTANNVISIKASNCKFRLKL